MRGKSFLDTNVWIYAATGRFSAPRKHAIARELVASENFAVSGQVVGEFLVNVQSKKMKNPLSARDALMWVDAFNQYEFVDIDRKIVNAAALGVARYQIHYWDSALIAQAESFGADVLYTEDLNHGQLYGSVRAHNPFLDA